MLTLTHKCCMEGWVSHLSEKANDMRSKLKQLAEDLDLDVPNVLTNIFWQEKGGDNEFDEVLRELAIMDGKKAYRTWLNKHIWTYVGLR